MHIIDNKDIQYIRNAFVEKHTEPTHRVSQYLSPSCLSCAVGAAFKLQGVEPEAEIKSFSDDGFADSGEARHKSVQRFLQTVPGVEWIDPIDYIKDNNLSDLFDCEYDYDVQDFVKKYNVSESEAESVLRSYERVLTYKVFPIKFRVDGIIRYNNLYYIIEIKTVGSKQLIEAPLSKHQPQGLCYSSILGIPHILWIYEDRAYFSHVICCQETTAEEREYMTNYIARIVENKDKPELLYKASGSECTYCHYKKHCKEYFRRIGR